ncbi:hypothetical protein OPT61_g792 [Boeremia exigua]|uniref:Uncharacterized protein n=1 Tax=Boeremia exigua TaxID=749465 RepID=A0ACC2ISK8_9PLEO|nr:hypothetical protein OPT61_g792 [Boeremia exigua]
MPAVLAGPRVEAARKRRPHVKSKRGCGNCKLRRVKCDEAQPSCRKCKLYGVTCDYSGQASFLDLNAQGSFQVHLEPIVVMESSSPEDETANVLMRNRENSIESWIPPLHAMSFIPSLASTIDDSLQIDMVDLTCVKGSWYFTKDQLQVVSRFRERTSLTIGNPKAACVYRDLVCQLACKHTFLMHMLLSVTLMHDAHLADPSSGATTTAAVSQAALEHWNIASELFNDILSRPIPPSLRDAIWATGVFLGAASVWSIGSTNVYEVWPLKPSEPDDLSWLKIGEGKKHLWRLAQPLRPDSIFSGITKNQTCLSEPERVSIEATCVVKSHIVTRILCAFGMKNTPSEAGSAYYRPILALSRCPKVKLSQENAMEFLSVMTAIRPEFLDLLEAKDMRAVFIMGWWYVLITNGDLWWMSRRPRIEGKAIRIWLRKQQDGAELAEILDEIEQEAGQY